MKVCVYVCVSKGLYKGLAMRGRVERNPAESIAVLALDSSRREGNNTRGEARAWSVLARATMPRALVTRDSCVPAGLIQGSSGPLVPVPPPTQQVRIQTHPNMRRMSVEGQTVSHASQRRHLYVLIR